jgi:2'-5' RNA ligase
MRLFTGLAIPPDATATLVELSNRLRPHAGLRWSRPEKLHVTLTFIGDWPEQRLAELTTALQTVKSPGPVELALHGLGWLPNPRFPRTLYTAVHLTPNLTALAAASSQAIASLGVKLEDRLYRPHVTLARVPGRPKLHQFPVHAEPIANFATSAFCLYLSSEGKYTKLEEFRF